MCFHEGYRQSMQSLQGPQSLIPQSNYQEEGDQVTPPGPVWPPPAVSPPSRKLVSSLQLCSGNGCPDVSTSCRKVSGCWTFSCTIRFLTDSPSKLGPTQPSRMLPSTGTSRLGTRRRLLSLLPVEPKSRRKALEITPNTAPHDKCSTVQSSPGTLP